MDFRLFILGYGDDTVIKRGKFDITDCYIKNNPNNLITLFTGYSEYEIDCGEKIKKLSIDDKEFFINLEIVKVSIGFGEPIDCIPKGYKCVILTQGSLLDISKVKECLSELSHWDSETKCAIAS